MKIISKSIIKIFPALLLAVMLGVFSVAYAIEDYGVRELDNEFLDIDENIVNPKGDSIYRSEDTAQKFKNENDVINAPQLKGGISELRAIVGKSQIVRFDEPVKRISITSPDLVDMIFLSPTEFIMNGKKGGETTVIIWGEGKEPVFFNLFVENNNLNFLKEVKKITPNEDLEIGFINSGGADNLKVVLKGTLSSSIISEKIKAIAKAYDYSIVDLTETLEPQVMLEVKIVEMGKTKGKSKEYEFKKGLYEYIDHTENISHTDWYVKLIDGTKEGVGPIGEGYIQPILEHLKEDLFGMSFEKGSLSSWKSLPGSNLSMKLSAAETEGLVKILSEPKVMTVNKNKANFTSGSQVPIPAGVDELGNVQYEYKKVGTTIDITPTILEDSERILLDISAEISEIDDSISTNAGPGFNTRESKTKVEVANNQTTVITGLVRKSQTKTIKKVPYLSNLPFIGRLFDQVTDTIDDTELMIFVTASIVNNNLTTRGN